MILNNLRLFATLSLAIAAVLLPSNVFAQWKTLYDFGTNPSLVTNDNAQKCLFRFVRRTAEARLPKDQNVLPSYQLSELLPLGNETAPYLQIISADLRMDQVFSITRRRSALRHQSLV